jgi:hypothetical protein
LIGLRQSCFKPFHPNRISWVKEETDSIEQAMRRPQKMDGKRIKRAAQESLFYLALAQNARELTRQK